MLSLRDTTTNPANFGSVRTAAGEKWKLLDFRVPSSDRSDLYANSAVFTGFMEGNGLYNYEYADFMKDIFRDAAEHDRKRRMAIEVMKECIAGRVSYSTGERKMSFQGAMQKAYDEVMAFVKSHARDARVDFETSEEDLKKYFDAVNKNFVLLKDQILSLSVDTESLKQDFTDGAPLAKS